MEWNDLIYCPLIGYFIIIITVLYSISLNKLPTRYSLLFNSLALIAFAFTWYYMILYFERSFIQAALLQNYRLRYYSIKAWLLSTSLFHQVIIQIQILNLKTHSFLLGLARSTRLTTQTMVVRSTMHILSWNHDRILIFSRQVNSHLTQYSLNTPFSHHLLTIILGPKFGTRKSWKYMLIGQIVAISFAQSLFFASLSTSTTSVSLTRALLPRS